MTKPLFWLDEYVRAELRVRAQLREALAYAQTYATLRPRLRWAARRPRALRLLKRLRLWHPPVIHRNDSDRVIGLPDGTVIPPGGVHFLK
jgi:hypothetical protein